jgi:hypothetical protein
MNSSMIAGSAVELIAVTKRFPEAVAVDSIDQAGLKTSKRGGYAAPLPKIYSGTFARYAPR